MCALQTINTISTVEAVIFCVAGIPWHCKSAHQFCVTHTVTPGHAESALGKLSKKKKLFFRQSSFLPLVHNFNVYPTPPDSPAFWTLTIPCLFLKQSIQDNVNMLESVRSNCTRNLFACIRNIDPSILISGSTAFRLNQIISALSVSACVTARALFDESALASGLEHALWTFSRFLMMSLIVLVLI